MKTKFKKLLSIILTLALTLSLFSNISVFATGSIEVGIKSNVATVLPNGDVKLTVDAKNYLDVTGGVVGFNLQISYDSTKFTYKEDSITLSTQHPNFDLAANDVPGTGMGVVTILGYDRLAVNQPLLEGDLFYVIFTAKSDFSGSADFEIAGSNDSDNVADDSLLIENSSVAASFPSPNNKVTISLTETVKIPVSIALKTEPTKKLYLQGETLDLTGGVITVSYNDSSKSDVSLLTNDVVATGFNNATIGKQIVTLTYMSVQGGVTYNVDVVDSNKYAKIEISSNVSSVDANGDVVIKVNANNFVNVLDGIVAFSFVVKYDITKFDFKTSSELLLQGVVGDGILSVENDVENSEVNVMYMDEYINDISKPLMSGDLFSLTFTAKDSSGSGDFEIANLTLGNNIADNALLYTNWEVISIIEAPSNISTVAINQNEEFVVNFVDYNSSVIDTQTVASGADAIAPAAPTRTGYTFAGWDKSLDNITADTTITAQYTINMYTVVFKNWDGAVLNTQSVNYATAATAPSNPTRTGYIFTGWDKTFDNITDASTVTAIYTINKYDVVFKNWDGSIIKTQNVNYATGATAPNNPSRTGYTFTGWDKTFDNITATTTVTAQYTINMFTVVFKNWDGAVLKTQSVNYATAATAPSNPTRTGYTFTGWDKSFSSITAATTVNALFTINSYTVTFNSMSGSAVASKSVQYNTLVATPTKPTRTGFTFLGWYTSSAYTTLWNFTTSKITANTTLYARWISTTATGLKAASAGYNSIKLTWTAISGANNYEIYRSTSATGTYVLVATIAATTPAYTNINLPFNTTYYYKVRGYALLGTTKTYSGYTAIASAKTTIATPTGLVATAATYNSTRLNWTAVAGANGYSVYRATSLTGTYSLLATVTTNTYTKTSLTPGATYYYKVNAYRLVGTTKVYGAQCAAVVKRVVPPTITTFTAVRASSTSIKLTWGAISGASGYELYRSTSLTGTYTLLKAQTLLTYTNTALKTGTTYYYKVRAYRLVGTVKVYGDFSAVKSMKP